ncbi:Uncharacterised protein [Serratia quinivorans]|nr:Uncharacterised protein [Serratia quinivorans]
MLRFSRLWLLSAALTAFTANAATETPKYGQELQGFHYPYPLL